MEKTFKNNSFSTPRTRRRGAAHPRKRIPLHGFGERSFARRHRRGEKRAPLREAWKGSRLRAWSNTQNHCKVLRFRTRNSYHLPRIITTRTPFSPDRMRKRCKGCHCAQATERHRAQTTESRQTPPPPRTPQNVAKSLKIQPPEAPATSATPALIQGYRPTYPSTPLSTRTQRAPLGRLRLTY